MNNKFKIQYYILILILILILIYGYYQKKGIGNIENINFINSGKKIENLDNNSINFLEKQQRKLGIKLTKTEENFLKQINGLTASQLFYEYKKIGRDNLKDIISEKGKNINEKTDDLSFLYLCGEYSLKGKKYFNKKFIDIIFPSKVLSKLGDNDVIKYFKKTCTTNNPGFLKGFEDEAQYGCNVSVLYYNNIIGNISNKELYNFLYNNNNNITFYIKDRLNKDFYNFFKDFLLDKKITEKQCINYIK